MTLLIWIVRLLVLLLIIRFVVTMVRQVQGRSARGRGPTGPGPTPKRSAERIGGTLVQDPQCGTYLPKERALAVTASGSTQYFCSDKCRDEWARRAS